MGDIKDLIERARDMVRYPNVHFHYSDGPEVMGQLADALTRAEKENAELREALRPFADVAERIARNNPGWDHDGYQLSLGITLAPFRRARVLTTESIDAKG